MEYSAFRFIRASLFSSSRNPTDARIATNLAVFKTYSSLGVKFMDIRKCFMSTFRVSRYNITFALSGIFGFPDVSKALYAKKNLSIVSILRFRGVLGLQD